jgi:hypothetical protein
MGVAEFKRLADLGRVVGPSPDDVLTVSQLVCIGK